MTTLAIEFRRASAQAVMVTDERYPFRWHGFRASCMELLPNAATGGLSEMAKACTGQTWMKTLAWKT
jgi:hypothetical protein